MKHHDMPELFNGFLPLKQMFLVSPCVLAVVGAVQTYNEQTAHLSDLFWCLSDPLVAQFSLIYQQIVFWWGR